MLADTLTLIDQNDSSVEFVKVSQDTSGTVRLHSASTLAEPHRLIIKHSVSGKGTQAVDRHLVQITRTKVNASGVLVTSTINLTFNVPRDPAIDFDDIWDDTNSLIRLIAGSTYSANSDATTAVTAALLRGES